MKQKKKFARNCKFSAHVVKAIFLDFPEVCGFGKTKFAENFWVIWNACWKIQT